ncbi:hypothetical protein BGW38_001318 [Lunasporangiospora selenospora]|uniref:F-box domain-containing protein n=1 Tax=Lunasporangiospora selenospora TaxID=979761 RepID=A0A9P6G2K3_9FUNG|nr:hypothetical protein BGW38_001318 [Lunasporangiospora selenospora]
MEEALAIAEIRSMIGSFVNVQDLYSCILVSKAWHESFMPWLYRTIKLNNRTQGFINNIRNRGHLIRTFDYMMAQLSKDDIDCLSSCTQIQTLLIMEDPIGGFRIDPLALALIRRSASTLREIRRLYLDGRRKLSIVIIGAMLNCPRLSMLKLQFLTLPPDLAALNSIKLLFSRLKVLSLHCVMFPEKFSWPENISLLFLQQLRIIGSRGTGTYAIQMACHSPNLKVLEIESEIQLPIHCVIDQVLPSCRQLEVLRIYHFNWDTAGRYELVDAVLSRQSGQNGNNSPPPFKWVDFPNGGNEQYNNEAKMYFNYIERKGVFAMLGAIDFRFCTWITSLNVQKLLCSCVNLRAIQVEEIYAHDVEHSPPWVCHQLEYFIMWIHFAEQGTGDTAAVDSTTVSQDPTHAIFNRLAQFRRLRVLDTSHRWGSWKYRPADEIGMCYRLGRGLELLEPLTRIHYIGFLDLLPAPREEDIMFMFKIWPNLCSIRGQIHVEKEEDRERVNRLTKRFGIRLLFMSNIRHESFEPQL